MATFKGIPDPYAPIPVPTAPVPTSNFTNAPIPDPSYYATDFADILGDPGFHGYTPLDPDAEIPSFEDWLTPDKQAYYELYPSGGTESTGTFLMPEQKAAAEAAGLTASTGNAPEFDYLSEFYNLPDPKGSFWNEALNYAPQVIAAAFGGAAASGELAGVTAADSLAAGGTFAGGTAGAEGLAGGAFDMGGVTGTGLETGMVAGPSTATQFTVGAGTTADAAAAAQAAAMGLPPPLTDTGAVFGEGPVGDAVGTPVMGPPATPPPPIPPSLIPGISDQLLGGLALGGLGYIGAQKQIESFEDLAAAESAKTQPFFDELQNTYSPDFDPSTIPGFTDALTQGADIASRQYTASGGNPLNNPAVANQIADATQRLGLDQLNAHRAGLAGAAGIPTGSVSANLGAINAQGQGYNALGYGAGFGLAPPQAVSMGGALTINGVRYVPNPAGPVNINGVRYAPG